MLRCVSLLLKTKPSQTKPNQTNTRNTIHLNEKRNKIPEVLGWKVLPGRSCSKPHRSQWKDLLTPAGFSSTFFMYNEHARSPPSQTTGKNTITGRFVSFHCMDFLVLNSHTSKGLFLAHTHRNSLTIRHKHNPIAKLNTQLNLVLGRYGPVVCLQC